MGRVLVIEPSDTMRQLLVRVLRDAGMEATGVAGAAEAVARCEGATADRPDALLAVCHDPESAAVAHVLAPLRRHPVVAGIPLVVVADDPEVAALARLLGARDCLVRVWHDVDRLVDCVRQHLPG